MTGNPAPPRGDDTRAALLEAAYQQFVARGYHGASMRSIAEAAGLAVGGIYNHFASKEDIFKSVILARHPLTAVLPALAAAEGASLNGLLQDAAQRVMGALEQNPEVINLLFIELVECEGRHLPDLLAFLSADALSFAHRLAAAPGRARRFPPPVLLRTFLATLFAYFITERLLGQAGNTLPTGDYGDFLDIYLHGVLAPAEENA